MQHVVQKKKIKLIADNKNPITSKSILEYRILNKTPINNKRPESNSVIVIINNNKGTK